MQCANPYTVYGMTVPSFFINHFNLNFAKKNASFMPIERRITFSKQ